MNEPSWKEVLDSLNNDFFFRNDKKELAELIEAGIIEETTVRNHWLGFPPATEDSIKVAEQKLQTQLPPSYKDFLLVSNGFRFVSFFLDNLFSVEKIHWTKDNLDQEWWFSSLDNYQIPVSDEKYSIYGKTQDSIWFRGEYLKRSLKISKWYDGMCIFLNPLVKFGDEWEVIEFADWFPGAHRYKSFKDYMIRTHEINVEVLQAGKK